MPEYTSPLVSSASRHPLFTDMLSSLSTPNMSSSPLTSPGGRPLGRGLDDSPAISGTSGDSRRTAPLDSGEVLVSVDLADHMFIKQHARLHAAHCAYGSCVLHPLIEHVPSIVVEAGNSFNGSFCEVGRSF